MCPLSRTGRIPSVPCVAGSTLLASHPTEHQRRWLVSADVTSAIRGAHLYMLDIGHPGEPGLRRCIGA
jgi:hypothetical protein